MDLIKPQPTMRCYRLASALVDRGAQPGETVSILSPNTPAMIETHFGTPLSGAILNTINHRLDVEGIAFVLRHGECRLLLVDCEFLAVACAALEKLERPPAIVIIRDHLAPAVVGTDVTDDETLLSEGGPNFQGVWPSTAWQPIALNYTSGTTGDPKGVVVSHRGTDPMSLLQMTNWPLTQAPRYLWTLPMFRLNGWCFTWAINCRT